MVQSLPSSPGALIRTAWIPGRVLVDLRVRKNLLELGIYVFPALEHIQHQRSVEACADAQSTPLSSMRNALLQKAPAVILCSEILTLFRSWEGYMSCLPDLGAHQNFGKQRVIALSDPDTPANKPPESVLGLCVYTPLPKCNAKPPKALSDRNTN